MKTYRRHNCTRTHRTHKAFAKCALPRAIWIYGEGEYASLAWCGHLTVMLYATAEEAESAQDFISEHGCGHACTNRHEIVRLELGATR